MKTCSVIDVFCGIGGLTHGFVKEGFNVIAGLDIDVSCQYAYEKNNKAKFICKGIKDVKARDILGLYPKGTTKILVGCAPCQSFSKYQSRYGQKDEKWKLLEAFADLIVETQPDVVSMENVPELLRFQKGLVFKNFVGRLERAGYDITRYLPYCPDYGIPQKRTRLVLFASKLGSIKLIEKTNTPEQYKTVRDAIYHLPPIAAGEMCASDPLHKSPQLSELNLKRIKQSRPGGTWEDWDEDLRAACHTKESGSTYVSVYGRMEWDEPAPTLTTECCSFGCGRFGHPEQDRAISLREAALIQTFPINYTFGQDILFNKIIARHIGNAVPVDLGRVIAKSIKRHLEELNGDK
ncbi:MAG: DNA cytosine methyltransferase [Ktedonobacteraceae bacterium]|nr:DNA cytosine methyltransferase [Ktedonobacteraceae bacterium]